MLGVGVDDSGVEICLVAFELCQAGGVEGNGRGVVGLNDECLAHGRGFGALDAQNLVAICPG